MISGVEDGSIGKILLLGIGVLFGFLLLLVHC
jgi:hypothetical protein